MDGKVVAGGAAAGLGLAPELLKNLAFDFSWSKNHGSGRRGTGSKGQYSRAWARVQISAESVFTRTLCFCQLKVKPILPMVFTGG